MITSVSTRLRELMEKEIAKLAQEHMTHPPTIGAMYEGLTRDILDRATLTVKAQIEHLLISISLLRHAECRMGGS
jgi:hypothetical protein